MLITINIFNLDFSYLAEALAQNSPLAKFNFEIIYFAEALAENSPPAKFCFYKDVAANIFRQTFLTYASEIYDIGTKILLLQ